MSKPPLGLVTRNASLGLTQFGIVFASLEQDAGAKMLERWQRKKWIFAAESILIVSAVSACQPTPTNATEPFVETASTYSGEILPFDTPYLLRYQPSPLDVLSLDLSARVDNKPTETAHIKMRYQISAIGDQRLFDFAIEEMTGQKGQLLRSSDPPLITAKALATSRGPITDADLDFPAFRGEADVPKKGSDAYRQIVDQLKSASIALPERPVRNGDTIDVGQNQFMEQLFKAIGRQMPPLSHIHSNTMIGKIVGQTVRNARTFIVIDLSGSAQMVTDKAELAIGLKGYKLIDTQTAASGPSVIDVSIVVRNFQKGTMTAELIARTDSNL